MHIYDTPWNPPLREVVRRLSLHNHDDRLGGLGIALGLLHFGTERYSWAAVKSPSFWTGYTPSARLSINGDLEEGMKRKSCVGISDGSFALLRLGSLASSRQRAMKSKLETCHGLERQACSTIYRECDFP